MLFLRRSVLVVPISEDEIILFKNDKTGYKVQFCDVNLIQLFNAFIRGIDEKDLNEHLTKVGFEAPNAFKLILDELLAEGIILQIKRTHGWSNILLQRFSRQLSYFSEYETKDTSRFDYQNRIFNARVLMLGIGSLGSSVLQHLVASGIGYITGVDMDKVESSNLTLQTFYTEADLGVRKVDAAQRIIKKSTSTTKFDSCNLKIQSENDIFEVLNANNFDLIILTADTPPWKIAKWTAQAALRTGVPMLRGNSLGIGPLMLPKKTACPMCAWPRLLREIPNADKILKLQSKFETHMAAAIGPEIAISGALIAQETIAFISGATQVRTFNAQLCVDMNNPSIKTVSFLREDSCPVCS